MNNLTMPKHSADPVELYSVLEVYGVASDWLDNKDYIKRIKKNLIPLKNHKRTQRKLRSILILVS